MPEPVDTNARPGTSVSESPDEPAFDHSLLWYTALHHLIDEVVFIHREDRSIAFVSPSVEAVLGYTQDEFRTLSTPQIIHPDDLPEAIDTAIALRAEPGASYRSTLRILKRDGTYLWVEIVGQNLLEEPAVRGVVQTLRDISERRALEDQLAHQARHDGLTGLANRNHVLDRLDEMVGKAAEAPFGFLYLDLDRFKSINDTHGHVVGDKILQIVADRLSTAVRGEDLAGRLGGDEFVAICDGVRDDEEAREVGERVRQTVTGPATIDGIMVDIAVSVGVARSAPGLGADHMVSLADSALYAAKRAGGKRAFVSA